MTSEQYKVLSAIRDGKPHTLWPLMRRAFLRRQWITPDGDPPTPSEERRAKAPVRPYAATRRGKAALHAYELEHEVVAKPSPRGPLRMEFGKDQPQHEWDPHQPEWIRRGGEYRKGVR